MSDLTSADTAPDTAGLTVESVGLGAVTDLGRRATHLGLSVGGALDQTAARLANALVGQSGDQPVVELVAAGARFRAWGDLLVALAGAVRGTVEGSPVRALQPLVLRAGDVLTVEPVAGGVRGYLALRGGFAAPRVLGSCAYDGFVGIGRLMRPGDVLLPSRRVDLGRLPRGPILSLVKVEGVLRADPAVVEVTAGPHAGHFADVDRLYADRYHVSERSNHVGLRLAGAVPTDRTGGEIRSSGVPIGAVEVPGGPELLVLHRGRGVTAGYPVVAVATTFGLDTLAQAAPGTEIGFRRVDVRDAIRRVRRQRDQIETVARRTAVVIAALGGPTC